MDNFCESPCLTKSGSTSCRGRRCLIRHSMDGDRVATELLFERIYAAVYRKARFITQQGDDAEDLAQETLVLAFQGIAQLKNPRLLLNWLSKIALNRHRERLRVSRFAPPKLDEFSEAIHSDYACRPKSAADHLIWRETANRLSRSIQALPPNLHQAFQLRVVEQLSTHETARLLGTTEGAVRTRLRRARIMLREQ